MELKFLRVQDFRNLAHVELEPGPRFNLFAGRNGQGKTNLLEAVYLLASLKSFRSPKNQDLIAWGKPQAVVEGLVDRAGQERRACVEVSPKGKRVLLNGHTVARLSNFFGSLNAIVFSPDDVRLLRDEPNDRRRFLDRAIFNCEAGYLSDVVAYEEVLRQRNALLKDREPSAMLLDVYDEQLATLGAVVLRRRLSYLKEYTPIFEQIFASIFLGEELGALEVRLSYDQGWWRPGRAALQEEPPDEKDAQEALWLALKATRGEDLRRQFTSRGPHRDDLSLQLAGHSARSFASQGQQRALVLALKITEVQLFQQRRGFRPLLLLDDVSSELDRVRNRFLFSFLRQGEGQVFLSTTHRDHILLEDHVASFDVGEGQVRRAAS